eukprot:11944175-Alexandrium_andersonii.AAC.1
MCIRDRSFCARQPQTNTPHRHEHAQRTHTKRTGRHRTDCILARSHARSSDCASQGRGAGRHEG